MKKNVSLMLATGVTFAAFGMYFGKHAPGPPAQAMPVGAQPAVTALFAQSLPNASGDGQSLAKWKGRPLVVNFWATWCSPCVEEMPALSALQTELAVKQVQIVGIGIDSPHNIQEFASRFQIAYPLYVAGLSGTDLSRSFGNAAGGLPYTVLISAEGRIVKTYLGKLRMDELRHDIAAM